MPAPFSIVVVDDSATTLASVAAAVAGEPDLELVGTAADGSSAMALLRERRPDVALVDVLMPDVSGAEVVRALRTELRGTTFVLMSTLSEPELALRSAMAGAASFVDKARGPAFCVTVALSLARRWDGLR